MTEKELFRQAVDADLLSGKDAVRARVLSAAASPEKTKGTVFKMKKKLSTLAIAAVLTCLLAVAATAAWLLSARDVAEELGYPAVAAAFQREGAVTVDQTQQENGYTVTLLGLTSGADLTGYAKLNNVSIDVGRTYAVTAVSRSDGTPLTLEDGNGLMITPLISGLDSRSYNIFSMGGSVTWDDVDGVLYFLTECDNLEIFADHTLYLAVMDGFVPTQEQYLMGASGAYSPNPAYAGLNLLFTLPIDAGHADPVAAAAYMQSIGG